MLKISKMKKILIIASFIIFCFSKPIFARYYESLEKITGKAIIAEPIIKVENLQNEIAMEVNKNSNITEYHFAIKNYDEINNKIRINEVDFLYEIEIKNSNSNFPIKFELYEIGNEEELLKGSNKISNIKLEKNIKYEKQYKVLAYWIDKENMSAENDVDVIIKATQKMTER